MTSEVKKTQEEMKNNKAPGIDDLTNNVMILGREESVKHITIFAQDLREKKDTSGKEKKNNKMIILHRKGEN